MDTELTEHHPHPAATVVAGPWAVSALGRGEHLRELCRAVDYSMPVAYGYAAGNSGMQLLPARVVIARRARMVLSAALAETVHSGRGRLGRTLFALRRSLVWAGQYLDADADAITCYGRDGQVTVLIDASAVLSASPGNLVELLASACVRAGQLQAEGRFELYRRCLAATGQRDRLVLAAQHLMDTEDDQVELVVQAVRDQQRRYAEPRRRELLRTALTVGQGGDRACG